MKKLPVPDMVFYLLGERAAVMQSSGAPDAACQHRIWAMAQQLRGRGCYQEVVPGMNNLSVVFDPDHQQAEQVIEAMRQAWGVATIQEFPSRKIVIPVRYGAQYGPDLAYVAEHAGLTGQQVIDAHCAARYEVYFLGFQPGFAYLGGLPGALVTPRRAEPRLSVPAGSVGIGGAQTGIYPAVSPGGWQLIGRTSVCLFNPADAVPTLLQPGDVIEFVPDLT